MGTRRRSWTLLTLVSVVATASVAATEVPRPPSDYAAQADELSQPTYTDTILEAYRVPMRDGVELYVEVTRPDPGTYPDERFPVIMEASPYHGTLSSREGGAVPQPLEPGEEAPGTTGYFAPRGYAVAMVDLRGTGHSGGCLDHLGPIDAGDLVEVIGWAADQPWATGRVGMVGTSYVGSSPLLAASQEARGLVTVVPSAGLASMYDHQFQTGVPYFAQYAGPVAGYPALTAARYEPFLGASGQYTYAHCGALTSSLTAGYGQVNGQYQQWHADRDWRDAVAAVDLPIFLVHGVTDAQLRIPSAEWFLDGRFDRPDDKLWLGQWGHSTGGARYGQWRHALLAWFDRHLKERDVDTGPPVEVFLDDGQVLTAPTWTPAPEQLVLHLDATTMTLGFEPPEQAGTAAFTGVPEPDSAERTTGPILGTNVEPRDGTYVDFVSPPLDRDAVLVGLPEFELDVSVTSPAVHVVTTLSHVQGDEVEPFDYCAIQPQLRDGVDQTTPVVPGEVMTLQPQCFTQARHLRVGDRLILRVSTGSVHHIPTLGVDARVTIHTGPGSGTYALPLRPDAVTWPDVPLETAG